jgi:hypothetical protein
MCAEVKWSAAVVWKYTKNDEDIPYKRGSYFFIF